MDVLNGLADLICNIFEVDVIQNLAFDHRVKVCLHVFKNHVDILIILGTDNVFELGYVRVASEALEDHHLSVGSLRVGFVMKCVEDLF